MNEFTEEELGRIYRSRLVRAHNLGHEVIAANIKTDKEIEEVLTEGGEMNPREIFISRLMENIRLHSSLRVLASSTTVEKGREALHLEADELLDEIDELIRRYTLKFPLEAAELLDEIDEKL